MFVGGWIPMLLVKSRLVVALFGEPPAYVPMTQEKQSTGDPLHLEWWSLPSASIGSCFRFWSTRTMRDPRSLNFGSGDAEGVNVLLALQMCRSNRLDMVNWGSLSQLELPVKSFNSRITRSYAGYTSITAQISIKQSGWAELEGGGPGTKAWGRKWWRQADSRSSSIFAQYLVCQPVSATCIKISSTHEGGSERRSDEVVVAVGCMHPCQTSELDRFT